MVSVIIAVYNGEKYIADAIESLLGQTYKDIEIIVADDGSTDRTKDIIKKYKNVKYIYQDRKGEGAARNLGISISRGKYLCFLDADDLYAIDKIEKQVEILENNKEVFVVYNDLKVVDENLNHINILKSEGIYRNRKILLAQILYRQVIQGPICMMIRRQCAEDIKWNEKLIYTVDYDYTINLAQKYNFYYLEEPLYIYRRHTCNLSNKHKETLNEEKEIIKSIGLHNIEKIVYNTSLSNTEKKILLGKINSKISNYKEAIRYFESIDEKDFNDMVYFNLGNCYFKLNDKQLSQKYYELAIQKNNLMAEAYNNLGCILASNNKTLALDYFSKAIMLRMEYLDPKINIKNLEDDTSNLRITEKELRKELTVYNSN